MRVGEIYREIRVNDIYVNIYYPHISIKVVENKLGKIFYMYLDRSIRSIPECMKSNNFKKVFKYNEKLTNEYIIKDIIE
jgi:hypothetical protein